MERQTVSLRLFAILAIVAVVAALMALRRRWAARRDEVVLIRQFRAGSYVAGIHPWNWEAVAGIIEDGESPADVVKRESVEEAGLPVSELIPLHSVMLTPGACSERCVLFLGLTDTAKAGGVHGLPSEGEDILVDVGPIRSARAS